MKNRVVRLTESDLENLVKRIIKEEGEEKMEQRDVEDFINALKKLFLGKYPKLVERLNTKMERIAVIAELAKLMGVNPSEIQGAKAVIQKQSQEPQSQEGL